MTASGNKRTATYTLLGILPALAKTEQDRNS